MNKLRKLNSKYMFLILVFIICFIGLFVFLKGAMYKCKILSEDEFATLKPWTVEKDNSKVILPYGFKYTGEPIVLTKKIDKANVFDDSQYLMVMSRYFDYTVYVDDTKLFDLTTPQNGFSKTMGTQLRLVRIGKDLNGKTIKLEIRPLLGDHIQYFRCTYDDRHQVGYSMAYIKIRAVGSYYSCINYNIRFCTLAVGNNNTVQ